MKLLSNDHDLIIQAGRKFLEEDEDDLALNLFEYAHNEWPDSLEACKGVADVLFKNEEYQEAIELYTRCLEIEPSNVSCRLRRAIAYREIDECEVAISELSKISSHNLNDAEAFKELALTYYRVDDFDAAKEACLMANKTDSQDHTIKILYICILKNSRQKVDAIEELLKLYHIDGEVAEVILPMLLHWLTEDWILQAISEANLIKEFTVVGDPIEANLYQKELAFLTSRIELDIVHAAYYYTRRGTLHYCMGNYIEAIKDYNRAYNIIGNRATPFVKIFLGHTCYKMGRLKSSIEHYDGMFNDSEPEKLLETYFKEYIDALIVRGRRTRKNHPEQAFLHWKTALELCPSIADTKIYDGCSLKENVESLNLAFTLGQK